MRFINAAIPVLKTIRSMCKDGLKVAKAIAHICVMGIVATTALISELPKLLVEQDEVEPP